MAWIVELLSTLGIFAGALVILVFFHELGHFLAAKLFGMRVERFSVGFPPRIWGFKKGETDYCLGATPLGGYVKISGMLDESMDTEQLAQEPKPWEFRSKPVWQRIIVISAGVIFNMILAAIIYMGMGLSTGNIQVPNKSVGGIYVADSTVAAQVGFETGDKIIAVNGREAQYFEELIAPTALTELELSYTVIRDGEEVRLLMPDSLLDIMKQRGFISLLNAFPSQISRVKPGSPAEEAGLQGGDKIVAINGEPINYWQGLVEKVQTSEGAMQLTIKRNGRTLQKEITPQNHKLGIYAPDPVKVFDVQHLQYSFFEAVGYGIQKTETTFTGIIQGFGKLFSGDISVRQNLGGPVAIAQFTKQATENGGWLGFWNSTLR